MTMHSLGLQDKGRAIKELKGTSGEIKTQNFKKVRSLRYCRENSKIFSLQQFFSIVKITMPLRRSPLIFQRTSRRSHGVISRTAERSPLSPLIQVVTVLWKNEPEWRKGVAGLFPWINGLNGESSAVREFTPLERRDVRLRINGDRGIIVFFLLTCWSGGILCISHGATSEWRGCDLGSAAVRPRKCGMYVCGWQLGEK